MIKLTDKDKTLVIPSGLGNFGQSSEGGGVTPAEVEQIASAVTAEALDEYDTELQVELEDIRDAVSGNTDAISELSGATSGMSADIAELSGETETQAAAISNLEDYTQNELAPAIGGIAEGLEALSGVTSGMSADIAAVSGQTSANTENIASLSAATEAISESLGNYATTDALSAVTSALTEDIEALSAVTSGLSEDITALSGQTSANTAGLAALSASTQSIAGSVPTANSAWINISDSAGTVANFNIQTVENTIATFNDKDVYKFAFSMYLCYLKSDADRYRGNLVAFEKSYNGVNRNFYFQFIIVIDEVPYNAEYYYNYNDGTMNKIAFEPYADYVSRMVSGGTDESNIEFFNLIKDYGNSNEELARLYDDMDAANTAGKTVVALSNFATGDTNNAAVFATFRKDSNGGFYGAGSGVHYNGTTYIAARAVPIFRRDDYFNVVKKDGHFYFSDMGTIAPYTLPTAAANTKGGVKVGSGLTMSGETMSVAIGDGLAYSGNSIVVSGGTGGGKETIIINNLDSTGLAALATRLFGYYDVQNNVINYPVDELDLYWWLPDPNYVGGYDDNGYKDYVKVMPVNVEETEWSQNGMWLSGPFSLGSFDGGNLLRNFRILILEDGSLVGAGVDAVPVPQEISYSWVRFGNDERGELTYDADNDCFYYDNYTIATGDTTNVYEDLIDNLMTDSMFEGGLIFGSIYPVNYFRLYVTENGETKVYTHPVLSKKTFENPVTIDSQEFYKEVTLNYGDWKFTAYYGANDGNNGACLRITTPYIV